MIPVAASPRVRDRLRSAPDGPVPVIHRGDRAIYLDVAGWCVGVVAGDATRVPCALQTSRAHLFTENFPRGPLSSYLGAGTLHLGSRPLSIGRLVATYVPRLGPRGVLGKKTSSVTVQVTPPTTVAEFVATHLPDGRLDARRAGAILGLGDGLTPLGDDLLCGWLAVHRAFGLHTPGLDHLLDTARERTTLLSATLLDCARHGEVVPEFAAWLRSLGSSGEASRVRALHRIGGTSGAALHTGGRLALAAIREAA